MFSSHVCSNYVGAEWTVIMAVFMYILYLKLNCIIQFSVLKNTKTQEMTAVMPVTMYSLHLERHAWHGLFS